MRIRRLHALDLSPREAIALQRRLAGTVVSRGPMPRPLRAVVGVDCAPTKDGRLVAVAVRCAAPDWAVVGAATAIGRPGMPYVPGLLSFRELPLVLEALADLDGEADLVLVDGQGRAHPRRLGIASHLGLHLDVPTVGVGKSRLVGTHEEPGPARGDTAVLVDRGETIGRVLRARAGVKPVYVSVGSGIGLRGAVAAVLRALGPYRLPEPVRQADLLSKEAARRARPS